MAAYLWLALAGFLSGAMMYSYALPLLLKGVDVCAASDDGNAGAANAITYGGVGVGLFCLLLDIAKGFMPLYVAWHLVDYRNLLFAVVMVAPIAGHILAPFNPHVRGKGISTAFGSLVGVMPIDRMAVVLAFFYVLFAVVIAIRPHELLSVFACLGFAGVVAERMVRGLIATALGWGGIAIAACVIAKALQSMPDTPHEFMLARKKPLFVHRT